MVKVVLIFLSINRPFKFSMILIFLNKFQWKIIHHQINLLISKKILKRHGYNLFVYAFNIIMFTKMQNQES